MKVEVEVVRRELVAEVEVEVEVVRREVVAVAEVEVEVVEVLLCLVMAPATSGSCTTCAGWDHWPSKVCSRVAWVLHGGSACVGES